MTRKKKAPKPIEADEQPTPLDWNRPENEAHRMARWRAARPELRDDEAEGESTKLGRFLDL